MKSRVKISYYGVKISLFSMILQFLSTQMICKEQTYRMFSHALRTMMSLIDLIWKSHSTSSGKKKDL